MRERRTDRQCDSGRVPDVGDRDGDDEKMGSIEKVFEPSPKTLISTPSTKHSQVAKEVQN